MVEPLDESRAAIVMVTEPIMGSLGNALEIFHNLPKPGPELAQYVPAMPEVATTRGHNRATSIGVRGVLSCPCGR